MKRASAVVRAWDGPNSRIAFELDLDQMPWGPFEALGKHVTFLVPAAGDAGDRGTEAESHLERALRHVEHAAERCAEFADLGNGSDQLWRTSLETWEWLREHLTTEWIEQESGGPGEDGSGPRSEERSAIAPGRTGPSGAAPDLPLAAATLEVAAKTLRHTPLAVWREAVGPYNPDAPTREEAIQTLLGVARLLGRTLDLAAAGAGAEPPPPGGGAPTEDDPRRGVSGSPSKSEGPGASEGSGSSEGSGAAGQGSVGRAEEPRRTGQRTTGEEDISFDYASGFDEGYRQGRRVGRALAARERRDREE